MAKAMNLKEWKAVNSKGTCGRKCIKTYFIPFTPIGEPVGVYLKDRRGDQRGGVNGSQSKFLTEFGLYPKINPNPQLAKSSGTENQLGYTCCVMA
jgi:hypothetical protein